MNKGNETIPKRVLSGVQRNVAILVDLLKAEGITPEVDYEVKYRPVITFSIVMGEGRYERAFFCFFVYHDIVYSHVRLGDSIKKSMRRTMCEYVVRANADQYDPGDFLLCMDDGALDVHTYCNKRLLREDHGLKDEQGNYNEHVFRGYKVNQDLKLGFDFDRKRLIEILAAIARSGVDPEFRVRFTVKDTSAVQDELFARASANARKIAEGLCRGVGKKLGDVLNINYSWQEIEVYGEVGRYCDCIGTTGSAPDINPDDLDASDSVVFTWELI